MAQNNTKFNIGLNIHLLSFSIPKSLIKNNEYIRVSITTLPEENKQNFHIPCEKMENSNHVFALNITNNTKKIIMVFRKKNFMASDPIIASTSINLIDFPKLTEDFAQMCSGIINTEVKEYKIYEPLHKQINEKNNNTQRKEIGKMKIQFSFTTPYPEKDDTKRTSNQKLFQFKPLKIKPIDFKNFDLKAFDLNVIDDENTIIDEKYDIYNEYQLF